MSAGIRDALLLAAAIFGFGVAFGALARQVGLAAWQAVLASAIILSGAAQFAMLGLLAFGWGAVMLATIALALRHLPMSARLSDLVGSAGATTRVLLSWVLVDETFGLSVRAASRGITNIVAYKATVDAILYSSWITGTIVGVSLGVSVDPSSWGVDVLIPLVFVGLAASLVERSRDWLVIAAAVTAALFAAWLLPTAWQATAAAATAALVGVGGDE